MRKLLRLSLATFLLAMTSFALTPITAQADQPCLTEEPVGIDEFAHDLGPVTVGGSGVKVLICGSPQGSVFYADQWAAPRVEPGSCEPSVYGPLCFTLYLESSGVPHWTNWTVYTYAGSGQLLPPISVNLPPVEEQSVCVLSIGYPAAPTHDCERWVDLGQ